MFGDGESKKIDPRCQTEDLGDDLSGQYYGIRNLQRILPKPARLDQRRGIMRT